MGGWFAAGGERSGGAGCPLRPRRPDAGAPSAADWPTALAAGAGHWRWRTPRRPACGSAASSRWRGRRPATTWPSGPCRHARRSSFRRTRTPATCRGSSRCCGSGDSRGDHGHPTGTVCPAAVRPPGTGVRLDRQPAAELPRRQPDPDPARRVRHRFGAAVPLGRLEIGRQSRVGLALVLMGAAIVVYNDPVRRPGDFPFTPVLFAIGWLVGFALRERNLTGGGRGGPGPTGRAGSASRRPGRRRPRSALGWPARAARRGRARDKRDGVPGRGGPAPGCEPRPRRRRRCGTSRTPAAPPSPRCAACSARCGRTTSCSSSRRIRAGRRLPRDRCDRRRQAGQR